MRTLAKKSASNRSAKAIRKSDAKSVVKKKPAAKAPQRSSAKAVVKKKTIKKGSIQLGTRKKGIVNKILAFPQRAETSRPSKAQLKQSNTEFGALVKKLSAKEINAHIGTSTWLSDLVYNGHDPSWCIPKLELLLRAGLNPDTPGLLHEAVYGGGPALRTLLRYGANPVVSDGMRCPFVAAAEEGLPDYNCQIYMEWLHEALLDRWATRKITKAEYESDWKKAMNRIRQSWKDEKQPAAWSNPRLHIFKEIHDQRFVYHSIYDNAYTYEGQLD
eukprot:TRINITY_DN81157_c0_g1_i1.p1 TRINITY_DN81157_c0_g1~~TRINITY_DN81157_c0_g1_i1.p1  ORF type:complete len:273 (+),score=39.90 TRINITY_DN81157_c0_g1_i1:40-858(+)